MEASHHPLPCRFPARCRAASFPLFCRRALPFLDIAGVFAVCDIIIYPSTQPLRGIQEHLRCSLLYGITKSSERLQPRLHVASEYNCLIAERYVNTICIGRVFQGDKIDVADVGDGKVLIADKEHQRIQKCVSAFFRKEQEVQQRATY
jgi:hypothetical protein